MKTHSAFAAVTLFLSMSAAAPAAENAAPQPAAASQASEQMRSLPRYVDPPPKPIFDPRTYGAKGDGVTYDTSALQKAIDACAGTGGSVDLAGGKFLSAQLTLRGGMTFYIEKDAVLLGGTHPEDYPVLLPDKPTENAICRSLLYANNADHLVLDGPGVIDGQGQLVKMSGTEPNRPSLIRVFFSKDVTVRNLTMNNPRMWTQVYLVCEGLTIDHVTVNAPAKYCPNLDGMDVFDGSNVTIRNCQVNSDDDSICLKTRDPGVGLHNITIENNEIRNTGANGIKIGTASTGPISGIHILNNTVRSAALGGLCIESVDGSAISDITVRNLDLYEVCQPIFIRLAHRSHTPGSITDVSIENLRAVSTKPPHASCTITGIPSARIGKVVIKNSSIEMPGGLKSIPKAPAELEAVYPQSNLFGNTPAYGMYVRHADQVILDHVTMGCYKQDTRPWLASDDATVQTVACRDLQIITPAQPRLVEPVK